jgi:hypothetical protein
MLRNMDADAAQHKPNTEGIDDDPDHRTGHDQEIRKPPSLQHGDIQLRDWTIWPTW